MILRLINWKGIAGIAAALALLGLVIAQRLETQHWRKQSDHFEKLYDDAQLAFAQTTTAYRAAADTARANDRANAARVTAEQQRINQRTADDFEKRLSAARLAAADRLRGAATAGSTDPRSSGAAAMPGLSPAPGSTAETAGGDRLPAAGPRDHALMATEQAIQLDELIGWVKRQAAVDPNAPVAAQPR